MYFSLNFGLVSMSRQNISIFIDKFPYDSIYIPIRTSYYLHPYSKNYKYSQRTRYSFYSVNTSMLD